MRDRRARQYILAFLFFVVVAAFKTYPLLRDFGTGLTSYIDPVLNCWILPWDVHALTTDPLHLFDANAFYPLERSLAFSEHSIGLLPVFAPVYLLTGNPVAGYNTVLFLSFAFSGLAAYALAFHFTRSPWASLVAGVLYGFAPLRFAYIQHLQNLQFYWAPLALLFLDRFFHSRRWRDLALLAVCTFLQALCSIYLAFIVAVALVLYAGSWMLLVDRSQLRSALPRLALAGTLCGIALLPVHLPYLQLHQQWQASWKLVMVTEASPDLLNFLRPPPMNGLYMDVLKNVLEWDRGSPRLFPGLLLPLLVLLGSIGKGTNAVGAGERNWRLPCWVLIVSGLLLSLGPYLVVAGRDTGMPLPYLLLYRLVPGFEGLRDPGRFVMLGLLGSIPLCAAGAARCAVVVERWLGARPGGRRGAPEASFGLIAVCLLELGLRGIPMVPVPTGKDVPEVYRWLDSERPGPLFEVPSKGPDEKLAMYFSTYHWLPLVNGRSGFHPPDYFEIASALKALPAAEAVEYAGALGIKAIVVHTDQLEPEDQARWTEAEATHGGLQPRARFGVDRVYTVPGVPMTSGLSAELTLPAWLTAGQTVSPEMLLTAQDGKAWAHPRPHGWSPVSVRWTAIGSERISEQASQIRLPPVLPAGDSMSRPLELQVPALAGRYRVQASAPQLGIETPAQELEVRDTAVPTSADAPKLLGATYELASKPDPIQVGPREPVQLRLTAINSGQAMWLARSATGKGSVRLTWRWLLPDGRVAEARGHNRLPVDVFPGQRYVFDVRAPAPREPGRYLLELELFAEKLQSFSESGSPALRVPVEVAPRRE